MKVLVAVDLQNDFVSGSLGTEEARAIVSAAAEKIKTFDGLVLFTRDTHGEDYLSTQEGRRLPVPHCIRNTEGWQLVGELDRPPEEKIFDKPAFGSVKLGEFLRDLHLSTPLESVTLVGLCTDICVISNAMLLKAFLPETEIIVDASCCAGVTFESHKRALETMAQCQITVENMPA